MKLLSLFAAGFALAATACDLKIRPPPCTLAQQPVRDDNGCMSCTPCARLLNLEPCAPGVAVTLDPATGCPSCRPSKPQECDRSKCTVSRDDTPVCTAGERPIVDAQTCCMSCKLPVDGVCTADMKKKCYESLKTLPVCTDSLPFGFDRTTCCYTCNRNVIDPVTDPDKECTKEKFLACEKANARVCETDEVPMRVEGQCCPSCARPEREVDVTDVAKCADRIPACGVGERPTSLVDATTGSWQCPTCKPTRPKCGGKCAENQVCVRSKTVPAGECKSKRVIEVIVRSDVQKDKDFIKDSSPEVTADAVKEIVKRFCDKVQNADECEKKQELLDTLDIKKGRQSDVEAKVSIIVSDAVTKLLDMAMADDEARGTIDLGEEDKKCDMNALKDIATCDANVKPVRPPAGSCPTCLPNPFEDKCMTVRCAAPSVCTADQRPSKVNCCLTCLPKKPTCNDVTRMACKARMKDPAFPVCPTEIRGEPLSPSKYFDRDTCCPKCKPPAPVQPPVACTKELFKMCLNETRLCEADEKPMKVEGQCCPSCFRKARLAPLRDVAKCGKVPDCEGNQRPIFVRGDDETFTCPVCKPVKPACQPACDDAQVCVPSDAGAKCMLKKKTVVKIKSLVKKTIEFLKAAEEEELKAMIKEVVQRFCDKTQNADRCELFKEKLLAGLKCTIKNRGSDDGVEVEVEAPADETRRRRLLSDGASSLLDAALNDAEATGDVSIDNGNGPAPTPAQESKATAASVSVVTAFVVSALAVLA